MKIRSATNRGLLLLAAMTILAAAVSAGVPETARKVIAEKGDAVITLEVVLNVKYSYGGNQQEQENKDETFGLVIAEDGLVVTSLSAVDPGATYERMMGQRTEEMSYTSTLKSIKYIMPDNEEIEATVVLRDRDLDLAFLRPRQKQEQPFTAVNLAEHADAEIMAPIFGVARMGKTAKRTVIGMTGEVQGMVEKPRKFYLPNSAIVSAGAGVPVFTAEGKLLGVVLLHVLPGAAQDDTNSNPVIPVVIPAVDIQEVAAQAPQEAPAEEVAAPAMENGEEPESVTEDEQ